MFTKRIGSIEINNPFILAPLAGITDAPMRRICREQGASLVYTEMVSGKGLKYGSKKTEELLFTYPDEGPVGFQLFGSEPDVMEYAVNYLKDWDNAIFDINMGCPVPKVVKNGEGSALMKNPKLAGDLVEAVCRATDKPVTVKIRAGWDEDRRNAVEVAKVAQEAGASAVTVHGRTREQYYNGKADREIIKAVKAALKIPVIGNGDIFCAGDAMEMMEETGCDMVMIARGALGNPWIFRECVALWEGKPLPPTPSPAERADMMKRHFSDLLLLKGEYVAIREMRKHAAWYIKGMRGAAGIRRTINSVDSSEGMIQLFDSICTAE